MSVGRRRLRAADWITAAGGLALLVLLFFFDWFGAGVSGSLPGSRISGTTVSTTGWQTFTDSRWIWLATILAALGSALAAVAYRRDGRVQPGALAAGLGAVSSALIVYRIAHHPSASLSVGHLHASYGIKPGIWLGLIAAVVITFGGYLQAQAGTARLDAQAPAPAAVQEPAPARAFSGLAAAKGASASGEHATGDGSDPSSRPPEHAP